MDTDLGTIIPFADIESGMLLGNVKNNQSDQLQKMSILVKFRKPLHKSLNKSMCKVKKPNFFVNEDLPSENKASSMFYEIVKKNIISGSASIDEHISVWIKPQSPNEFDRLTLLTSNS